MELNHYQKEFLRHEIKWGIKEIEGRLKERKRQLKEKEINWSESTLNYIIDQKKQEIEDLKKLAKYLNLDLN